MRLNGIKLSEGDIWVPKNGMVAAIFYGGLFRFAQGVGGAYTHGKEGLTADEFFAEFPSAERIMKYKRYETMATEA